MRKPLFIVFMFCICWWTLLGEPLDQTVTNAEIKPYSQSWVKKGSGKGSSVSSTRLQKYSQEELKKTLELDKPVVVEILSVGGAVDSLESIKDRIIRVKITNPNPYAIFVQGRQYKDNKTIKEIWKTLKNGLWADAGWDWCGTGVRDWEISPSESIDVILTLHPDLKEQQILGRFFKQDKPSIQSDCLLYENK